MHIALPEDLNSELPRRLVRTGGLTAIVWLVVHHEPDPTFRSLVTSSLKVPHTLHLPALLTVARAQGLGEMHIDSARHVGFIASTSNWHMIRLR